MLKQEWKSILKTKKMLIILFGISLIPSLYTVLFLSSMWDPYGKLAELPVAVVNQDMAVSYNEETLGIGDSLVAGLEKSDSLDFHFVSEEEAEAGLADGTYYMALTIPENFSENAITLLDATPNPMALTYRTSAGRSYIASKLTASAAKEIKDSISAEVTAIYAETIFDKLQTVAEGMQTAADGSAQLSDGTVQIKEGNESLSENLQVLADSSLSFRDGAETLAVGLQTYLNGVGQLDAGATALNDGAAKLTAAMPALQTGVGRLNDGAAAAAAGSVSLSNGISSLATNSLMLSTGMDTLNSGMGQLSEGSASLTAGLAALNTSLTSAEQQAKLTALQSGLDQIKNGIETLDSQLQQSSLSEDLATALSQLDGLSTTIASFQAELNTILAAADPASNTTAIMAAIAQSGTELTNDQEAAVNQAVSAQMTVIANEQSGSIQTITNDLSALSGLNGIDASAITQQVTALQNSISSLSAGYATVYGGATTLVSGYGQIGATTQALLTGGKSLQAGISNAQSGSQQLADGLSQLSNGSEQLAEGGQILTEGNTQVSAGLQTLNEQTGTLTTGAAELKDGTKALANGTTQLVENGSLLTDGTSQLAVGAEKISDGSGQLADGSEQLNAGLITLLSGTDELGSQLLDGSTALNAVDANENTYAMMAEPVVTNQIETAPVANNGTAMAPYMMSVALFVGAISLNLMYDIFTPRNYPKNGRSWWASKISVLAAVGICQALIMVGLLVNVNGLAPSSIGKLLLLSILTALVSVSIVMFFNLLFDKVGSFLMLIFLILQLSGSGGTYPIQLSNSFFEAIHPYLPMTYSIDAYRQLFGLDGSISMDLFILLAILIAFNLMIILFYTVKRKQLRKEDFESEENPAALEIQTA
ncbi:putative membrane protein [Trichococcus patagoniensis]|uniref:Putative membrane protein n=1 Tax=Trichococcus patagoniensis TaxID=382641 RepID=A0A2T5IQT9_9LACT|nr:YhgE/Pip domain-containing protein [Trichococcus patagoniensis]PTQ86189.1 putative membrane protein [Trichococcus patagoniensis]